MHGAVCGNMEGPTCLEDARPEGACLIACPLALPPPQPKPKAGVCHRWGVSTIGYHACNPLLKRRGGGRTFCAAGGTHPWAFGRIPVPLCSALEPPGIGTSAAQRQTRRPAIPACVRPNPPQTQQAHLLFLRFLPSSWCASLACWGVWTLRALHGASNLYTNEYTQFGRDMRTLC